MRKKIIMFLHKITPRWLVRRMIYLFRMDKTMEGSAVLIQMWCAEMPGHLTKSQLLATLSTTIRMSGLNKRTPDVMVDLLKMWSLEHEKPNLVLFVTEHGCGWSHEIDPEDIEHDGKPQYH